MLPTMSLAELGDLDAVIRTALAEDLAEGDVTSRTTVPETLGASARIVAKQDLVMAGGEVFGRTFELIDPDVRVETLVADGQRASAGDVLVRLYGNARSLLAGERTALNFLQRLCGTATLTRRFVDAAAGRCRITDTRKTTPGLRMLQRYAVRCGGGVNHRNDLGSGVLIKENHIRCAGGVDAAVRAARDGAPHSLRVECEVTTLDELAEAIAAGADAALLDNMDDDALREAVRLADGRLLLEASGGMTLARVATAAASGVDLISVGALTHSAPAADISMLFEEDAP